MAASARMAPQSHYPSHYPYVGELFERIVKAGRFVEDEARYFFQQLISGVHHCHCSGVCHRDLKLVSHWERVCDSQGCKKDLLHGIVFTLQFGCELLAVSVARQSPLL